MMRIPAYIAYDPDTADLVVYVPEFDGEDVELVRLPVGKVKDSDKTRLARRVRESTE